MTRSQVQEAFRIGMLDGYWIGREKKLSVQDLQRRVDMEAAKHMSSIPKRNRRWLRKPKTKPKQKAQFKYLVRFTGTKLYWIAPMNEAEFDRLGSAARGHKDDATRFVSYAMASEWLTTYGLRGITKIEDNLE